MSAFDSLADARRWVAWRTEARGKKGKPTKVPYSPRGGKAQSDNPETWGSRQEAEQLAKRIVNGTAGGTGIVLGDLGNLHLAGLDLDSCIDAGGSLSPWAEKLLELLPTYAEISPSGSGIKVFFYCTSEDVRPFLEVIGITNTIQWGAKRAVGVNGADHGPGIEIYFSHRYFTITEHLVKGKPDRIATLDWPILEQLAQLIPTAGRPKDEPDGRDASRSAKAFREGARLRREGRSFAEMCEALRSHLDPEIRDWTREKGEVAGDRELHRIWDRAGDAADGLPIIQLQAGNRPQIVIQAIDALDAAEVPLYRRGLQIVDVAMIPAKASDGAATMTPAIVFVPCQQLAHELGKAAHWEKYDGRRKEWRPADPPGDIAATIIALPNEWKFRSLAGIITTQTMRPDGTLLTQPGYDPATGYLLFNPPPMLEIRDEPTREHAIRALRRLQSLLSEFPFVDEPSRSVALSMLMAPVLRPALPPAVPMHAINSPAGGTGKSYLVDLASALAIGEVCPVIARGRTPEETEKRLVGAALEGRPIIAIDNVNGELRSEFLCQVVERPILSTRALCKSDLIKVANTTTTFANGNNIQIFADLVRRTIQSTLDANMERPETRKFKRNPLAEILARRGLYVASVLTIARAYIVAGRPMRPAPFASFDGWNELVRGPLLWLGCADPVDTVADLAVADPVKNQRAEVFRAIADAMPEEDVGGHRVAEIVARAKQDEALRNALMLVARDREGNVDATRLGYWLRDSANTIAAGLKLLRNGKDASRVRWQFIPIVF